MLILSTSQHLYKSPAIEVYVTADYHYPDLGCLVDFFAIQVEKLIAGIEPTTLDLCSQSGAYDLSATATPAVSLKHKTFMIYEIINLKQWAIKPFFVGEMICEKTQKRLLF